MTKSQAEPKLLLCDLNQYITCNLCNGYLIDAVSITECLHPFCKSCIVKYLEDKYNCPSCGILIHQSHPLNYISSDRTLQDIVYKVVPDLKKKERKLREDFYLQMGKTPPVGEELIRERLSPNDQDNAAGSVAIQSSSPSSAAGLACDHNYHRHDEQVNVQLEPGSSLLEPLSFKYLRLSALATVTHLRKYVAQQVLRDISRFRDIDIFILNTEDGTFLGRDHVLKFVRVVYWNDDEPMPLQYRFRQQIY